MLGNINDYSANKLIEKSLTKGAWKSTIPANDLDKHMLITKQVLANGKILQKMIGDFPINDMKILVPGCGTGQIFDYLNPTIFYDSNLIFTDINKEYLEKLDSRLKKYQKISYKIIEDDIENTKIKEQFDSCILILILEHVDWEKAILGKIKANMKIVIVTFLNTEFMDIIVTQYAISFLLSFLVLYYLLQ